MLYKDSVTLGFNIAMDTSIVTFHEPSKIINIRSSHYIFGNPYRRNVSIPTRKTLISYDNFLFF